MGSSPVFVHLELPVVPAMRKALQTWRALGDGLSADSQNPPDSPFEEKRLVKNC
jgi:hypothetical protein